MENATASPQPKQRWYRNRKLAYLLVLLIGCIAAFFAWDALFMPADLRRMQGTWNVAKILTVDDKHVDFGKGNKITFVGRHVMLQDDADRIPIEICDGKFVLYDLSDDERTILGVTMHVPNWWRRPIRVIYGSYEFIDHQLIFWLKGGKDLVNNTVDEREDHQLRVFLERR